MSDLMALYKTVNIAVSSMLLLMGYFQGRCRLGMSTHDFPCRRFWRDGISPGSEMDDYLLDSFRGGRMLGTFHDHFDFTFFPLVFSSHNGAFPALDSHFTSAFAAHINLQHALDLPFSSLQLWGFPKVAFQVAFRPKSHRTLFAVVLNADYHAEACPMHDSFPLFWIFSRYCPPGLFHGLSTGEKPLRGRPVDAVYSRHRRSLAFLGASFYSFNQSWRPRWTGGARALGLRVYVRKTRHNTYHCRP